MISAYLADSGNLYNLIPFLVHSIPFEEGDSAVLADHQINNNTSFINNVTAKLYNFCNFFYEIFSKTEIQEDDSVVSADNEIKNDISSEKELLIAKEELSEEEVIVTAENQINNNTSFINNVTAKLYNFCNFFYEIFSKTEIQEDDSVVSADNDISSEIEVLEVTEKVETEKLTGILNQSFDFWKSVEHEKPPIANEEPLVPYLIKNDISSEIEVLEVTEKVETKNEKLPPANELSSDNEEAIPNLVFHAVSRMKQEALASKLSSLTNELLNMKKELSTQFKEKLYSNFKDIHSQRDSTRQYLNLGFDVIIHSQKEFFVAIGQIPLNETQAKITFETNVNSIVENDYMKIKELLKKLGEVEKLDQVKNLNLTKAIIGYNTAVINYKEMWETQVESALLEGGNLSIDKMALYYNRILSYYREIYEIKLSTEAADLYGFIEQEQIKMNDILSFYEDVLNKNKKFNEFKEKLELLLDKNVQIKN